MVEKVSEAVMEVTPMMVDTALDAWLNGPSWRDGRYAARLRREMRKALVAALEWK